MRRARPSTIYLLHQTSQGLRSRLEHAFRTLGATGIQYTVLGLLDRHAGLSSADLSRRFFVTPQTMNQIVGGMLRRGLIERTSSDTNRRILEMKLTSAGETLLQRCEEVADRVEAEALALLPERQLEDMRQHLALLLRQLRVSAPGPAEELPAARIEVRTATPARRARAAPRAKALR